MRFLEDVAPLFGFLLAAGIVLVPCAAPTTRPPCSPF